MQRHEEKHIGKEGGEGIDKDTLRDGDIGCDDEQDEIDFESGYQSASKLQQHGGLEGARVLVVQGGYLLVDAGQFLPVALDERLCPALHHREVTQDVHTRHRDAFLVALEEEPDGQHTDAGDDGKEDTGEGRHLLSEDIEEYREEPEPEMAEDMGVFWNSLSSSSNLSKASSVIANKSSTV